MSEDYTNKPFFVREIRQRMLKNMSMDDLQDALNRYRWYQVDRGSWQFQRKIKEIVQDIKDEIADKCLLGETNE